MASATTIESSSAESVQLGRLLRLPVELRLMIYGVLFTDCLESLSKVDGRPFYPLPPVFRVCTTLRCEALKPWMQGLEETELTMRKERDDFSSTLNLRRTPHECLAPWQSRRFYAHGRKSYYNIQLRQFAVLLEYSRAVRDDTASAIKKIEVCGVLAPWPVLMKNHIFGNFMHKKLEICNAKRELACKRFFEATH